MTWWLRPRLILKDNDQHGQLDQWQSWKIDQLLILFIQLFKAASPQSWPSEFSETRQDNNSIWEELLGSQICRQGAVLNKTSSFANTQKSISKTNKEQNIRSTHFWLKATVPMCGEENMSHLKETQKNQIKIFHHQFYLLILSWARHRSTSLPFPLKPCDTSQVNQDLK